MTRIFVIKNNFFWTKGYPIKNTINNWIYKLQKNKII